MVCLRAIQRSPAGLFWSLLGLLLQHSSGSVIHVVYTDDVAILYFVAKKVQFVCCD